MKVLALCFVPAFALFALGVVLVTDPRLESIGMAFAGVGFVWFCVGIRIARHYSRGRIYARARADARR